MKQHLLTLIFGCILTGSFAQPGSLDSSFDSDGKTTTSIENTDIGISAHFQTDGKLLVAGISAVGAPGINVISIVRYLPNGALDGNFGSGGIVKSPISFFPNYLGERMLAVQPDGKIVVGGYSDSGDGGDFAVARFLTDGSPDQAFGTNGIVKTDFNATKDGIYAVLVQTDGKIVAAGVTENANFYYDLALARYLPDGAPDPDFGTSGKTISALGILNDYPFSALLQPDGKIVLSGISSDGNGFRSFLARYQTDGNPDSIFGNNGVVLSNAESFAVQSSLQLQSDNKLLTTALDVSVNLDLLLNRYNSDGSPDQGFGINGTIKLTPTDYAGEGTIALQPDGKILVAASVYHSSKYFFWISRLNSDGSSDNTFGTAGSTETKVGNSSQARAITLSDAGRIAVVGDDVIPNGFDFAVAIYLSGLVGTNNYEADKKIVVFPNPCTSGFQLNYAVPKSSLVSVYLSDTQGRRIKTFIDQELRSSGAQTENLTVSNVLPGFYVLTIILGNEVRYFKLVIGKGL